MERKHLAEQKQYQISTSEKRQVAIRVKKEQEHIALKNSAVKQDSSLASKKEEAPDHAVSQPKSKPNVCDLNPGKFKGCSVF